MDILVIGGSIVGSVVAALLVDRWLRADKRGIDLKTLETRIEEREKAHEERHRLELRQIEHRLEGHDKLLDKLSKRYHDMREMFLKALVRSGVSVKTIADIQNENDDK